MTEKILETNNYTRFELSPFNRNVGRTRELEESMKEYGFLPYPILVRKNGQGKFIVLDGHHRLHVARKLGIPVKYVETKQNPDLPKLAGVVKPWDLANYVESYRRSGDEVRIRVWDFHQATGIGLSACISLQAGDSAGSGNQGKKFKIGDYQLGDPAHADFVGGMVLFLKEIGIAWAANQYLVQAISKIGWVKELDPGLLKNKLSIRRQLIKKQASKQEYILMLEKIYNYGNRKKIPLAFLAEEMSRQRMAAMKSY